MARSAVNVKSVLCPTKCMVSVVLVQLREDCERAPRASAAPWEGVGSLAFMYTTKWVSAVRESFMRFASRDDFMAGCA